MHRKDVFDAAAEIAGLGPDARAETLTSGGYRYEQRMGWALSHLSKAGWVDRPARGYYAINDAGRNGLLQYPNGFDYAQAREFFAPFGSAVGLPDPHDGIFKPLASTQARS